MSFKIAANITFLTLKDVNLVETPIFNITTDPLEKAKIIDADFRGIAGIRSSASFDQSTLAYWIENNAQDDAIFMEEMNKKFLEITPQISTFIQFLWFIKDNSISVEQAYGIFTFSGRFKWRSDHNIFSTCTGEFKESAFNSIELLTASDLLLLYVKNCVMNQVENNTSNVSSATPALNGFQSGIDPFKQLNRIERALTFLSSARSTPHLPQKIAHYMAILECLLSGDSNEVVHKVSERTAYYLGDSKKSRIEIYKKVKEAYGIRSKFVHGDKIKKSHEFIVDLSSEIDNYIRQVLQKIITTDYNIFLNDKKLEEFQNQMIF
ncbi:hypothetical protein [Pedobacter panaciterrae]